MQNRVVGESCTHRENQGADSILAFLLAAISRVTWARSAVERAERDLDLAFGPAVVASVMLSGEVMGEELALAVAEAGRLRDQGGDKAPNGGPPPPPPAPSVVSLCEPEALLLSVAEAARLLGVTRDALDKRIQRGQVPGIVRTGRRVQVLRPKLLAALERRAR
jgi:excisionase family DNA binding protein